MNISKISRKLRQLYQEKIIKNKYTSHVKKIKTHMTTQELDTLYKLARECGENANILEIGSYVGASSCYIAAGLIEKGGSLFCVDTWENQTMLEGEYDTMKEFLENTRILSQYIIPIRKNSQNLAVSDINNPLNFAFIDGNHSYAGVNHDYCMVAPWIIEGGILAFHDCIHFEGVSRTIGEALASGKWQFSGHVDNLMWFRKIERKQLNFAHPEVESIDNHMTLSVI
ncbi:MAG: class I SAM-dependent methyltransferase [Cyanobacteria bacterium P01_A01_bin.84]